MLSHLLVLDLSRTVAGSYCAKLLADYGAQVLKVESAAHPDPLRSPPAADAYRLAMFAHLNTSKKSVELDLAARSGRAAFLELAVAADAIVEDWPVGELDRLGAGFETLSAVNSSLVLTSITPFGQTGPYKDFLANDLLMQAMASRMSASGVAPRPPVRLAPDTSYFLAGTLAAGATLAAVWSAMKDGQGDHLDISIMECLLGAPDRGLLMWEYGRIDMPRPTSPRVLQNFPCSDGFIAISLVRGVHRIARAIGRPELMRDARFATNEGRQENSGELEAVISSWTVERTRREAFEQLQSFGVTCAPVNTIPDLLSDPQFVHRGAFREVEYGGARMLLPGKPFRERGKHPHSPGPPPVLGQDSLDNMLRGENRVAMASGPPLRQADAGALPLDGVRVIDFGDAWAGPYACTLLGDAGAEVIRIEDVHRMPANMRGRLHSSTPESSGGDVSGYAGRKPGRRPWDRFYLYNGCERNKYGITLDLKQERGRDLFLKLVQQSDVVVSNYAHGALRSLRLEYDDLIKVKPDIIMLYISGYGADGPYEDYVALGSVIDAVSGHQSLRGYPETAPADTAHTYYPDVVAAYTGFFAVMAALHRRAIRANQASPQASGLNLEMALTEALFPHIGGFIGEYSLTGRLEAILGNRDPQASPHGCYPTRDLEAAEEGRLTTDRWLALYCSDDAQWRSLAHLMGRDDLADDTRFATASARKSHEDELDALIADWTRARTASELMLELQAAGVPAMSVMADSDIFEDPHVRSRGFLREIVHREAGVFRGPGPIWHSRKHDLEVRLPANCLGEHNRLILQGLLGITTDEFAALEAAGVCGEVYALDLAEEGQQT
jgi:crotonobetainyl-CoA:carnitine CoA-transferase CaiB-like acyl-CoA transferase